MQAAVCQRQLPAFLTTCGSNQHMRHLLYLLLGCLATFCRFRDKTKARNDEKRLRFRTALQATRRWFAGVAACSHLA